MKMDVTRERVSSLLEQRETLPSFQNGFDLVSAAVVCTLLEGISVLKPSSDTTEPRYLKLVTVSSLMPLVLFVINLVFSAPVSYTHLRAHET